MAITFSEQDQTFTLDNGRITYAFGIEKGRYLAHRHFGRHVRRVTAAASPLYLPRAFAATPDPEDMRFSLSTLPREYPDMNQGDFRTPAYVIENPAGDRITRFRYARHRIVSGKPALAGLPSAHVEEDGEAETLIVTLVDETIAAELDLVYTIFRDLDVVCRHAELRNMAPGGATGNKTGDVADGEASGEAHGGEANLVIEQLASMSIDMPVGDYDVITLSGAHQLEKQVCRRRVGSDMVVAESIRGASSPQATPTLILTDPAATEDAGEVWAASLVWSGDFRATVQRSQYGSVRLSLGVNPLTFGWTLGPGESFTTPECVLVYSHEGLGGMSRTFHQLVRKHVCRGAWRDRERPVLLNSWEAFTFDIDERRCLELARAARDLGVELFVLDDGWFRGRTGEPFALGDWEPDPAKFPHGLGELARRIQDLGLSFGIWFEPEMVSPRSDLIRTHPDWAIGSPRVSPTLSRQQLVLDLSRPDVRDFIVEAVGAVLRETGATYVKWDMNRHMTDLASAWLPRDRQRELSHRYMLGLYEVLERLTSAFPEVLFEGCSSGGGRFDLGMLAYMPQTWTSDDTDAIERLKIQYGTSLLFPPITMGAHVSAVPNHETGRVAPLETRFAVAAGGNLGYEFDIRGMDPGEAAAVQQQIAWYLRHRRTIQTGTLWRLANTQEGNDAAWEIMAEDGSEAVVTYVRVLADPLARVAPLRLRGLDAEATYLVTPCGRDQDMPVVDAIHSGDELMHVGFTPHLERRDFEALMWVVSRIP